MLNELLVMYLETAVEGEQGGEPSPSEPVESQVTEPVEPSSTTEPVQEYEIDGEKLTLEQIKEYRNGYLRQSDYTKKTQEISALRKENEAALEVYNFLKANPEIAQKLAEYQPEKKDIINKLDPVAQKVDELDIKLKTLDIDRDLNEITSKDKDVTDVELLTIAQQNMTDIKTAYNIWKGQNVDKIIAKRLAEQSKQITQDIQKNSAITKTLISPGDKSNTGNFGLSDDELMMAAKLDMTPEEYAKWK